VSRLVRNEPERIVSRNSQRPSTATQTVSALSLSLPDQTRGVTLTSEYRPQEGNNPLVRTGLDQNLLNALASAASLLASGVEGRSTKRKVSVAQPSAQTAQGMQQLPPAKGVLIAGHHRASDVAAVRHSRSGAGISVDRESTDSLTSGGLSREGTRFLSRDSDRITSSTRVEGAIFPISDPRPAP
jgi:hypothetical protein